MAKLKKPWKIIDVSQHNGKIDWEKVKADGIDGAIIRCGFGTDNDDKDDDHTFEYNANECVRLNIPFGIYHYSYLGWEMENMTDKAERLMLVQEQGLDEAKNFWSFIAPYEHKITLPVFIDVEEKCSLSLTGEERHYAIKAYTSYIESRNMLVGIYASKNPLETKLNWSEVLVQNENSLLGHLDLWCANWTTPNAKPEDCPMLDISAVEGQYLKPHIWQYTNQGTVSGIVGRVDINYCYIDYATLKEETGLNGAWANGIDLKPNERGKITILKGNEVTEYLGISTPFHIFRNEDGGVHRGIKDIGEDAYFFNEQIGVMAGGEQRVDGEIYLFRVDNGKMVKSSWLKLKTDFGERYKFYLPNGKMARFNKFKIDNVDYIFAPDGTIVPEKDAPFITWGSEYGDINIVCGKEPYDPTIPEDKPIEPEPPVDPPVEPEDPDNPIIPPVDPSEPTDPEIDDKGIVALLKSIVNMIIELLKKLFNRK